MAKFFFSAFADEAADDLDGQIAALKRNGIGYIEPRFVDKKGILTLTEQELIDMKKKLDAAGITVGSLGSPIGKYPIEEPFDVHLEDFKKALRAAKLLPKSENANSKQSFWSIRSLIFILIAIVLISASIIYMIFGLGGSFGS